MGRAWRWHKTKEKVGGLDWVGVWTYVFFLRQRRKTASKMRINKRKATPKPIPKPKARASLLSVEEAAETEQVPFGPRRAENPKFGAFGTISLTRLTSNVFNAGRFVELQF